MNVLTENNTGKGIHIFSTKSGPLLFLDYVNDKDDTYQLRLQTTALSSFLSKTWTSQQKAIGTELE